MGENVTTNQGLASERGAGNIQMPTKVQAAIQQNSALSAPVMPPQTQPAPVQKENPVEIKQQVQDQPQQIQETPANDIENLRNEEIPGEDQMSQNPTDQQFSDQLPPQPEAMYEDPQNQIPGADPNFNTYDRGANLPGVDKSSLIFLLAAAGISILIYIIMNVL